MDFWRKPRACTCLRSCWTKGSRVYLGFPQPIPSGQETPYITRRKIRTNLHILALAEVKAATLTVAAVVVTAAAVVTAVAVVVVTAAAAAAATAVEVEVVTVAVVTAAVVLPVVTA